MGKKNRRKNNTNNSKVSQATKVDQKLKQAQAEEQILKQQQELNAHRGKKNGSVMQNDSMNLNDDAEINTGLYQYPMEIRQHEYSADEFQITPTNYMFKIGIGQISSNGRPHHLQSGLSDIFIEYSIFDLSKKFPFITNIQQLQNIQLEQCRGSKEQMVQRFAKENRMNQHAQLHHRLPLQQQQQHQQIYTQQNVYINENQIHQYNQFPITRNHHQSNINCLSLKDSGQPIMIRRFERKQISKSCDDAIKRSNYNISYEDDEDQECNDIYQAANQEYQKQPYHVYLPSQQNQNKLQYQSNFSKICHDFFPQSPNPDQDYCDEMGEHGDDGEDEGQIEYDENEEFDNQQNLQIQFCNTRHFNQLKQNVFQQNENFHINAEDDQEYEEEYDDEEEEDDDEGEIDEDSYTYNQDTQNLRFQANILPKNQSELQQNSQGFKIMQNQILQHSRQQNQYYQQQMHNHQQLLQYKLEQQQLQNLQQQGKQQQSNYQQQQNLQKKQILQQQQVQMYNPANLQQLQLQQQQQQKQQQLNQTAQQRQQQHYNELQQQQHYINQNNSYYANGNQNKSIQQNSTANYQNTSQKQKNRGCKTPSTDDNSESFNHSARTNSFQKSTKQSSQSLKKSSVERVAVYGKPKSESEKKHTPTNNSFISQESDLSILTQQKFKYLRDEHLDLEQILNKIYFEEYTYDELKEFVIPALREIQNINNFFDILFNSIRVYAEDVKQKIINRIKEINIACSGQSEAQQNRIFEISEFEQIINKNFHKQSEAFIRITNQIYEQYQAVEKYSKQTEKIVYLYINHFIEKNRSIRFNCEDLHRRIFIFFVFADPQINNYLEAKFRQRNLYGSKYQECSTQLNKMHDILIKKNQYIPSEEHPINIEIYEKEACDDEEEEEEEDIQNDERYYQGQPHISQQSTMNQKLLKKRNQKKNRNLLLKKQQQQFAQGQYNDMSEQGGQKEYSLDQFNGICEYINGLDDPEIKKKKKKKKKNKGASSNKDDESNTTQQNGDDQQQRDSSTEKVKKSEGKKKGPTCHMNEELESFQKRLEDSFKNLKEHQKIQPIISENWILKIKEKYAKLKVRLNK